MLIPSLETEHDTSKENDGKDLKEENFNGSQDKKGNNKMRIEQGKESKFFNSCDSCNFCFIY
jgi:hypothetical protein